jgi:hypothetical protein
MKAFSFFGGVLIVLGVLAIAGSAGDCDGKCGPGNDLSTMLFIIFWAMVSIGLGSILVKLGLDNSGVR